MSATSDLLTFLDSNKLTSVARSREGGKYTVTAEVAKSGKSLPLVASLSMNASGERRFGLRLDSITLYDLMPDHNCLEFYCRLNAMATAAEISEMDEKRQKVSATFTGMLANDR